MTPKRRLLIFVVLLAVLALGGTLWALRVELPFVPRGEPTVASWGQLGPDSGYVEVLGTAHYPVRVKQSFEPTWLKPNPPTLFIFPFFAQGDTMGREIQILVLSQEEPDRLLGLQDRTIRGEVVRPTNRLLTRSVLDTFRDHGYGFADGFLLLIEDPPEEVPSEG